MKHSTKFGLVVACALLSACAWSATVRSPQPQNSVWVCHGGRNPTWKRVSANAAAGHQRHGDQVTDQPQNRGERCGGDQRDRERERDRNE